MNFFTNFVVSMLVFSIVIVIHELGHFVVAKKSDIKVNEFSVGMGPKIASIKKGETAYSLRALPIGGYVAMEGEDEESESEDSFSKAPVANRIAVVVAGAVMNLVLGFAILVFMVSQQDVITSKTVSLFHENAMTQQTGLQVNDKIIAVNGKRCYIANDIITEFYYTEDGRIDFTVIRDDEVIELEDVTFKTYTDENGVQQLVLDFYVYPVEKTVVSVVREAANWTISYARLIFSSLVDMISGNVAINQISGPVGMVSVISEATSKGWEPVFNIMALITINLGVFNLVPFPALDGGRLVFLLIEFVRGKPINPKYEIWVNTAGMIFLLGFMAMVTFSDITRLIRF